MVARIAGPAAVPELRRHSDLYAVLAAMIMEVARSGRALLAWCAASPLRRTPR